ncbi:MAG: hypothetical protein QOF78_2752, partial [Phycisphaerales bacterium]|nr:hypothetical protein [Phycisphaerales bacterium]
MACSLLLALFGAVAFAAARGKSATYDEPLHVLAAWEQWHRGDFRLDPENPPLWKYWAALPNGHDAIAQPPSAEQMRAAAGSIAFTTTFVVPPLYHSAAT